MSGNEIATTSIDFETILQKAISLPGIKVDRSLFLKRTLSKHYSDESVKRAIETNPAQAGISVAELERISKACINYETSKVTGLSAAAGMPGGWFMAATIPADAVQFFGHILRILQKLAYLYGWQDMHITEKGEIDDETLNELVLFIGVMFGVAAANVTLFKIAELAAQNVPKKLVQEALTKGTIYPIVKKIASAIGVKMTKAVFAKGVGKVVPVVGAIASGTITYVLFKPMSKRLKNYLAGLKMASVEHYQELGDENSVIDVDYSDIVFEEIDKFEEDGQI